MTVENTKNNIEELGKTLKTQFSLLATGDLDDPSQARKLQELSVKGRELQTTLAGNFGLTVRTPPETLAEIIVFAETHGLGNADLKEALAQLIEMNALLPKDACPTVEAVQDAARQALNLRSP